ncbi:hypothetical protein SAMN05421812_11490 [Asanoa hainanensis]|uniref:Uncharacterized protein n=1 Tax=Asanoa hainanensis TaxID=560556 RepID=A0A239P5U2_9ACTN|nr:hypothetical protein SAMN05421812_11490 [Asanoa hainanensis]
MPSRHGGFATGAAAAGGPLAPHETALAARAGVPATRAALFAWYLGEAGQAELGALLDSGAYRVDLPEQAALLTVAWLLRAGDRARALAVLDEIGAYADRLDFAPVPAATSALRDPAVAWRQPAGAAGATLAARLENPRVAAMREALTVWNPFADELLELWLAAGDDAVPPGWVERAGALLDRYRVLAVRRGLVDQAVATMLAKRGRPGSAGHAALRSAQTRHAGLPAHHELGRVVRARLDAYDPAGGIDDVDAICAPVTAGEAATHGVPAGTPVPEPIRRIVRRATAGTVAELVAAGVLPSAEVLAQLVPQISGTVSASGYPDAALRALAAATYRAFRRRRSLLLLDLQHQVRLFELPWMAALRPHRAVGDDERHDARETLRRLGELALERFPATLLPNPLVVELAALGRTAGEALPWVAELAADIFMGRFSATFAHAARLAGDLLAGSLYARYYDIDYAALPPPAESNRELAPFDELCHRRAGPEHRGWSVAGNGMVIEQAQILTTHNLATLAGPLAVVPAEGWASLARRAFATVVRLAGQLDDNPRPLRTVKDIAYAWRQMIFFLSLSESVDPRTVLGQLREDLAAAPGPVRERLAPALTGLGYVAHGGRFDGDRTPAGVVGSWAGRRPTTGCWARPRRGVGAGSPAPRRGWPRRPRRCAVPSRTPGGSCRAPGVAGRAGSRRPGRRVARSAGSPRSPEGPPRRRGRSLRCGRWRTSRSPGAAVRARTARWGGSGRNRPWCHGLRCRWARYVAPVVVRGRPRGMRLRDAVKRNRRELEIHSCAARNLVRTAHDFTTIWSGSVLAGDGEFEPEAQTHDAREPDDAHQNGVTVEVLLGDGRAGEVRADAAAEHAGQAAALAAVQEDQHRQQHARDDQQHDQRVGECDRHGGGLSSRRDATSQG